MNPNDENHIRQVEICVQMQTIQQSPHRITHQVNPYDLNKRAV